MAKDRKIPRKAQDEFAASSYQKAVKAQAAGLFDEEIAPLKVQWEDPKTGDMKEITVTQKLFRDGTKEGCRIEGIRSEVKCRWRGKGRHTSVSFDKEIKARLGP